MLNKKVAVSFILSLLLIAVFSLSCSAVEMGMDKDKAADELQKNRTKNCQRIIDLGNMIEVEYNNSDHFLDRYYYNLHLSNKITHVVKYYINFKENENSHEQLLPSMIKTYGKPSGDYYSKKDGSDYCPISKFKSFSEKEQKAIIKKRDRLTLWEKKKEFIALLSYSNHTYVMRFWKGMWYEFPVGDNNFRDFTEN